MKQSGYTLLELAVVLAVFSTLLASAVPSVLSLRETWGLRAETVRLAELLDQARLRAVSANTGVRVTAFAGEYMLGEAGAGAFSYPVSPGVRFYGASKSILFSSRGTASPGATLTLVTRSRQASIIISPTGRVRIAF